MLREPLRPCALTCDRLLPGRPRRTPAGAAPLATLAALTLPAVAQCDWDAATGQLPGDVCPPWQTLQSTGVPDPALAGGHLTVSTSAADDNLLFLQQDPVLSLPPTLVIEATVQLVSGSTEHPSRGPAGIVFDLAPGRGNLLHLAPGQIFLNQHGGGFHCIEKGPTALVPTQDAFHTYRIEVDTGPGGAIDVYQDGVHVLGGTTFEAGSVCFLGSPRIFWGEVSSLAFGESRWKSVTHNAVACVGASETIRLGTPPNPSALHPGQTSAPVIGATWDPRIDDTGFHPAAVLHVLGVSAGVANVPTALGTLLCDLSTPPLLFTATPGTPFAIPIPEDCALVGAALCAQGFAADPSTAALTNALDIVIGVF